jgi:hypothetical protein
MGCTFIHLYYNRAANVRKSKNPRATLGERACPARLQVVGQNQDRESRLIAFSAFLARWRKMLDREMKRDLLQNEQNVLNYKGNLPEFDRQAVIVERDLAKESQEPFRKLVIKAGSYSEGAIESQTRAKKLEILSDINQILSLIGRS